MEIRYPRSCVSRSTAALAQLVEHHHGKVGVAGSSPAGGFLVKSQLFNKELGFFVLPTLSVLSR